MDLSVFGIMAAGLLTFLSPCVLPLVPVYLGILAGGALPVGGQAFGDDSGLAAVPPSRFKLVFSTVAFVAGFTLVFSVLGLSATFIGRALVAHRALFQQFGGLLIVLLGLYFMGWLKLPFMDRTTSGTSRLKTRFHYVNALLMGLAFAFIWTPCIGAVLGSVLTYTSLKTTSAFEGMGLLAAYGLGFGLPLIAFSFFAGWALPALVKMRRFIPVFSKVTGIVMVAAGLLMNTGYLDRLDAIFMSQSPTAVAAPAPEVASLGKLMAASGSDSCDSTQQGATCAGLATNHPVVLEFFSPGCHICRQMIPIVDTLKNDCADEGVSVRLIDVSTESGRALAREYGVTGIPVFVFEDEAGVEKARLVGRQTFGSLQQTLNAMSGKKCEGYRSLESLKK
jgi:cytochrome c-type biogenesis protein